VARSAVVANAVKLYTHPRSRGRIVEWYIQELGLKDVEMANLDLAEKQHKAPDFLNVNPFGKVPALSDGELNLFESGALLTYLADKYGDTNTPEKRARAAQWTLFANSTLANALFVEQFREKSMPDVLGSLDKVLADKEFLEGGKFSVSDVAVGAYLLYVPVFLPQVDMSPYPNVVKYMDRMKSRPACAATVAAVEEATTTAAAKK
jgi:glutathione S-transferase